MVPVVGELLTSERLALSRDQYGATPLHKAVLFYQPKLVKLIADKYRITTRAKDQVISQCLKITKKVSFFKAFFKNSYIWIFPPKNQQLQFRLIWNEHSTIWQIENHFWLENSNETFWVIFKLDDELCNNTKCTMIPFRAEIRKLLFGPFFAGYCRRVAHHCITRPRCMTLVFSIVIF